MKTLYIVCPCLPADHIAHTMQQLIEIGAGIQEGRENRESATSLAQGRAGGNREINCTASTALKGTIHSSGWFRPPMGSFMGRRSMGEETSPAKMDVARSSVYLWGLIRRLPPDPPLMVVRNALGSMRVIVITTQRTLFPDLRCW